MAEVEAGGLERLIPTLARLARSGSLLVATDFDGTLAPVVRDPARARPLPRAQMALRRLALRTPVAVISGRDLSNLAVQCPVPEAMLLGSYGLEPWRQRRDEPEPQAVPPSPALARLGAELEQLVAPLEGVEVEVKSFGIAVHYRKSPNHRLAGVRVRALVLRIAAREGLSIVRGKLVFELRGARAGDKGTAMSQLLDHIRPRGCIFAGDDLGDLPAVRELHRPREGLELALAFCVLGIGTPEALLEEADRWIQGPQQWAELLELLALTLDRHDLSPGTAPSGPEPAG